MIFLTKVQPTTSLITSILLYSVLDFILFALPFYILFKSLLIWHQTVLLLIWQKVSQVQTESEESRVYDQFLRVHDQIHKVYDQFLRIYDRFHES